MREKSQDHNLRETYKQENLRLLQEMRQDLDTIDSDILILTPSERQHREDLETRYERLTKQTSPERDAIEWLHGQILLFKNEIEKLQPVSALDEFDSLDDDTPLPPPVRTPKQTQRSRAFLSNTLRVPALPAVDVPQPHEQIFTDTERLGSLTTPLDLDDLERGSSSTGDAFPTDDELDFSGVGIESDSSPLPGQSTEPLPDLARENQHVIELQHSLHRLVSELNVYPRELFRPEERSQIDASEYASDPNLKIPPDKVNFFVRLLESHIKELSRIKEELYIRIFRTLYDPMERQIRALKNNASTNEYIQNQIHHIEERLEALTSEAGKIMTDEVLQKVKDLNRDIRNLEDLVVQIATEGVGEIEQVTKTDVPEAESEDKIIADIYIYRSQIREILKTLKREEDHHTTLLRQIKNLLETKNSRAAASLLQRTLTEFDGSDLEDESTSQLKEIQSLLDEKNTLQAYTRTKEIVENLEKQEDENTSLLESIQNLLDQANYIEARRVAKMGLEDLKQTQEYQKIEETMKKESWLHTSKETIEHWTNPQEPAIPGAFGGKCFAVLEVESKVSGQVHYFYKISEEIPLLASIERQISPDIKLHSHYYRVLPHILEGEKILNLLVSFKKEGTGWKEDIRDEDREQLALFNERWMQLDEKELEDWLKGTPLKNFKEDYLVVIQIYEIPSGKPIYFCKFTNTPSKIHPPQGVKGKVYTLPLRKEPNPLASQIEKEFNELKDGVSYKNDEPLFVRKIEKPHQKRQFQYPPELKNILSTLSFPEIQFFLNLEEIYNEDSLEKANAFIQEMSEEITQSIIQNTEALRVIKYLHTSILELRWPQQILNKIIILNKRETFPKKTESPSLISEAELKQEISDIPEIETSPTPLEDESPISTEIASPSRAKTPRGKIPGWSRIAAAVLGLFVGVASYFVKGLKEENPQKAAVMKIRVAPRENPQITYTTDVENSIPQNQLPSLEYLSPDTSSDIKTEHLAASPKETSEIPPVEQISVQNSHEVQIAQKGQSISSSVIDDLVKNHHIPRKLALKEVASYIIKNTLPWLVHEGDTIHYTFSNANGQFSIDSITHTKKGEEKHFEALDQTPEKNLPQMKETEKGEIRIGLRTFKVGETIYYLPTNKQPGKYTVLGLSADGQKLLLKNAENPRLPQFAVNIENLGQRIPGVGNETFTIDGLWMEKLSEQVYKIRFSTTSGKGVTKALATLILHQEYKDDQNMWKTALGQAQEAVRKANSTQEIPDSETNLSYLKIPDLVIPGKDHIIVSQEDGKWAIKFAHFSKEKTFQIE